MTGTNGLTLPMTLRKDEQFKNWIKQAGKPFKTEGDNVALYRLRRVPRACPWGSIDR